MFFAFLFLYVAAFVFGQSAAEPSLKAVEMSITAYQNDAMAFAVKDGFNKTKSLRVPREDPSIDKLTFEINAFLGDRNNGGYIKNKGAKIDYAKELPKVKVILAGEIHFFNSEEQVEGILKSFKNPYLASEFFSTDMEDEIEVYRLTKDDFYIPSYAPELKELRAKLIKLAGNSHIIALENGRMYEPKKIAEKINEADDYIMASLIASSSFEFHKTVVGLGYRNGFWLDRLSDIIKDDNTIVVYGGMGHMLYGAESGSLSDRLAAENIETAVIFLISKQRLDVRVAQGLGPGLTLVKMPEPEKYGFDFMVIHD